MVFFFNYEQARERIIFSISINQGPYFHTVTEHRRDIRKLFAEFVTNTRMQLTRITYPRDALRMYCRQCAVCNKLLIITM